MWKTYSGLGQASEMEYFVKIVNGWKLFNIFIKHSILDVNKGSEYAYVYERFIRKCSVGLELL